MTNEEERPIPRTEVANLLVGPYAPTEDEIIIEYFQGIGFTPPDDFVVTPFDWLVLSEYLLPSGLKRRISGEEVADTVNKAFADLDYPSIRISSKTIHDYFDVLRGGRPGIKKSKDVRATSANFPEIRERYNCLVILKLIERSGREAIPNYKRDAQYIIATMIVEEQTKHNIMDACSGIMYPSQMVDTLILDLYEHD